MGYAARTSHLSRRRGRFYQGRVTWAEVGERRDAQLVEKNHYHQSSITPPRRLFGSAFADNLPYRQSRLSVELAALAGIATRRTDGPPVPREICPVLPMTRRQNGRRESLRVFC
jgi:hypothetical protein